jgi:Sugar (and other) transporter
MLPILFTYFFLELLFFGFGQILIFQLVMPGFGWRWLLALSSLPSFALLLFFPITLESPRYLCMKGRTNEATQVLATMARVNQVNLPPGKLVAGTHKAEEENQELDDLLPVSSESAEPIRDGNGIGGFNAVLKLLGPNLVRPTLLLWTVFLAQAFLYYGLVLLTSELSSGNRDCEFREEKEEVRHVSGGNLYKSVFITSFGGTRFYFKLVNFILYHQFIETYKFITSFGGTHFFFCQCQILALEALACFYKSNISITHPQSTKKKKNYSSIFNYYSTVFRSTRADFIGSHCGQDRKKALNVFDAFPQLYIHCSTFIPSE